MALGLEGRLSIKEGVDALENLFYSMVYGFSLKIVSLGYKVY